VSEKAEKPEPSLAAYLSYLWVKAGCPSSRTVAQEVTRRTGYSMSHTTVNDVRKGKRVPRWYVAEAITQALDGDVGQARELWARDRMPKITPPELGVSMRGLAEQMEQVTAELQALRRAVVEANQHNHLPELRVDIGPDYYDNGGVTQWP
jgi:hypothetical protein